jgi:exopolyphosphatase/pppGpp-phosphohydrolase
MRIGALDLGTSSFHLLGVDAHADGSFEVLFKEREMLRLGGWVANLDVALRQAPGLVSARS